MMDPQAKTVGFLQLPPEIRNQIYYHVLIQTRGLFSKQPRATSNSSNVPPNSARSPVHIVFQQSIRVTPEPTISGPRPRHAPETTDRLILAECRGVHDPYCRHQRTRDHPLQVLEWILHDSSNLSDKGWSCANRTRCYQSDRPSKISLCTDLISVGRANRSGFRVQRCQSPRIARSRNPG